MGIYVVTGGTKGIGGEAVKILKNEGHTVLNVDRDNGDLCVDLGTKEGRQAVIDEVHKLFPDGIDGLACNAAIASSEPLSKTIRVNYFGPVTIMNGLFDLLKAKQGRCVITLSSSLSYSVRNHLYVDRLLADCGDEERIAKLVDTFDPVEVDNCIYGSTKMGLARWMRRTAPWWAKEGVKLNAVAPGGVHTTIMQGVKNMGASPAVAKSMVSPLTDNEHRFMLPEEVAPMIVNMLLPGAGGCSGTIVYCDAGGEAVLRTEKLY